MVLKNKKLKKLLYISVFMLLTILIIGTCLYAEYKEYESLDLPLPMTGIMSMFWLAYGGWALGMSLIDIDR